MFGHGRTCFVSFRKNKDAGQAVYPSSPISTSVDRCSECIIPLVSITEILNLYSASEANQAGISLHCSKTCNIAFIMTMLI